MDNRIIGLIERFIEDKQTVEFNDLVNFLADEGFDTLTKTTIKLTLIECNLLRMENSDINLLGNKRSDGKYIKINLNGKHMTKIKNELIESYIKDNDTFSVTRINKALNLIGIFQSDSTIFGNIKKLDYFDRDAVFNHNVYDSKTSMKTKLELEHKIKKNKDKSPRQIRHEIIRDYVDNIEIFTIKEIQDELKQEKLSFADVTIHYDLKSLHLIPENDVYGGPRKVYNNLTIADRLREENDKVNIEMIKHENAALKLILGIKGVVSKDTYIKFLKVIQEDNQGDENDK